MNINPVDEKLSNVLYYSPSTGIASAKRLYEKATQQGTTFQQVKDYFSKQDAHQMFTKNHQELKIIFLLLLNIKMKYYK